MSKNNLQNNKNKTPKSNKDEHLNVYCKIELNLVLKDWMIRMTVKLFEMLINYER